MNKAGSKHLTLSDRINIEKMLSNSMKLKEIADELNKDSRTIAKEIIKHRQSKENGDSYLPAERSLKNVLLLPVFPMCAMDAKRRKTVLM